jgi:DNA-directed RNA polymerase specialized sigma24 family protein
MTIGTQDPARISAYDAEGLARLLGPLTVHEREVFLLRYFCGYSPREAGETLGVSHGTATVRLRTGVDHLKADLTARGQAMPAFCES